MAEGNPGGQRLSWNLNNIPVSMNVNRVETTRMRENLSRVVRDLLPELGNQPGVLMGPAARAPYATVNMGSDDEGSISEGIGGGVGAVGGRAQRSHSHNHSHYQPYSVTHGHTHAPHGRGRSTSDPVSQDAGASLVINIGADNFPRSMSPDPAQGDEPEPDENQNMAGSPGHTHGDPSPQTIPLRSLYRMMEGSIPFLLFLFAKIMYNHRLGILVFVGLCLTFCYANKTLKKHIAERVMVVHSQEGPLLSSSAHLVWIVTFLSANIFFIYYVFGKQQLHNSLTLRLPALDHVDLWLLLWVVGITDFVIKFGAIILKALVALIPRPVLAHKKRGKFYMLIEHVSQFYRCLVPIVPWIAFLQDDELGGPWFAYMLLLAYTICKGQHMWQQAKELRQAFSKFQVDVSYGSCPSRDDLSTSDNCCPICQDKFNEPVKLSCKHIFCEDCVSMWFDRERTCPMCRANIVDDPVWRDGATSSNLQLF